MTDIEWPEGATHRINGIFTKWIHGVEFSYLDDRDEWYKDDMHGSDLDYYRSKGVVIIERPKEPEVKEPVINWGDRPSADHVILIESNMATATRHWVKKGVGYWANTAGLTWSIREEGTHYTIHYPPPPSEEPEPYKPEVGDTIEALMTDKWVKAKVYGAGEFGGCLAKPEGYWYDEFASDRIRPIKSEREEFIEKAVLCHIHNCKDSRAIAAMLYDNGARFTDE